MRPPPRWLREGLIFVGNWETLVARARHGGLAENMGDLYKAEHSEDVVRRLKDVGVNMILMHYFKTGLRVEEEERVYAEQLAGFCRKYGMRVGAYIGGTIYYETLAQDDEDCVNWAARDEDGRREHERKRPHGGLRHEREVVAAGEGHLESVRYLSGS